MKCFHFDLIPIVKSFLKGVYGKRIGCLPPFDFNMNWSLKEQYELQEQVGKSNPVECIVFWINVEEINLFLLRGQLHKS